MEVDANQPLRLRVDFQNADPLGRVRLNTAAALKDLAAAGTTLANGQTLLLLDGELRAEGSAVWSVAEQEWTAAVDWDEVVDSPMQPED